jgi:hypothetical protein
VPEDLVPAVLFLASEGSRFMTGQTVNVDGGCVHVEAHRARKHAIELNQSFEGRCRRDITPQRTCRTKRSAANRRGATTAASLRARYSDRRVERDCVVAANCAAAANRSDFAAGGG